VDRAGPDDQEQAPVVGEDEPVDVLAGARDEFGLRLGLGHLGEERRGRGQGPGLDDIDVGRSLHGVP
jgi:hypothetical protein